MTYKEVATKAGNPKAARAVGAVSGLPLDLPKLAEQIAVRVAGARALPNIR